MNLYYIVSADHVALDYAATHKRIRVGSTPNEKGVRVYYADAAPYGCGKNQPTPEAAIKTLLRDNGCSNIKIHRREFA